MGSINWVYPEKQVNLRGIRRQLSENTSGVTRKLTSLFILEARIDLLSKKISLNTDLEARTVSIPIFHQIRSQN